MIEDLVKKKRDLCKERDLCAELYNVWITKLHDFQDDPEKYEMYIKMINNLEPYGQMLKAGIAEINREICKIEGVDSIGETSYTEECVYKYGYDRPNN